MSKRIGIGGKYALAFGFSWQTIDELESLSSQRKKLMSQGMTWEAMFKAGDHEFIGSAKHDFAPIKGTTTLAGAAQMAMHPRLAGRTVLIIMEQPVENEEFNEIAIVGLINGNIVIDDYTNTDHAKRLRVEFSDRAKRSEVGFEIVGKSLTQGPVVEDFDWADFRPAASRWFPKTKGMPAIPVKPLEPKIVTKIALAALVGIAAFSAIWFYIDYQQVEKTRKAEQAALARKNSGPIKYTQSLKELLSAPVLPASSTFAAVREAIGDIETKRNGWRLKNIKCLATAGCSAIWENDLSIANYREFTDAAPKEWGGIVLNHDGTELSHKLPLALPLRALPSAKSWPDTRSFLLNGFSQWQKYWVLGFHPELAKEPAIMGLPSGVEQQAAESFPDATWAIKWSIKKTPWYLSEGFDSSSEHPESNLPGSVTVESISINFEKDQTVLFDAEGQVYVRK
jgi:hypothetical protein